MDSVRPSRGHRTTGDIVLMEHTVIVRRLGLTVLCLLAIGVGVITGLGAILFRGLIGLIHNVFHFGHLSLAYDVNVYSPPSPWIAGIILVPARLFALQQHVSLETLLLDVG
jgi:hypothetical protein